MNGGRQTRAEFDAEWAKRMPAAPPYSRRSRAKDVSRLTVGGDTARREAVAELASAARDAAEAAEHDDAVTLKSSGAFALVDLSGTVLDLRASRLRHLVDALVAQRTRPSFPDVLHIRWRAA